MRYACIFAHPDDEMRCLGTLLRLREAGHEVSFVAVSAGDRGLPYQPLEEHGRATEIRAAEMQSVAAAFDGEYICLDQPDGYVVDSGSLRQAMIDRRTVGVRTASADPSAAIGPFLRPAARPLAAIGRFHPLPRVGKVTAAEVPDRG